VRRECVVDHVFICCAEGAPEAETLVGLGLREGSANAHPGQGTSCKRFFFDNAYLELIWVTDARDAKGEATRATRLWERWRYRGVEACPFGVVLSPGRDGAMSEPPFPTWSYRPSYLADNSTIEVARDTPLREPGYFYLESPSEIGLGAEPLRHEIPLTRLTSVKIEAIGALPKSAAATAVSNLGLVEFSSGRDFLLELIFDQYRHRASADLRPDLPLLLRW